MEYVLPLQRLIEKFCTLKGVGYKTAVRYAFSVLDMDENEAEEFANAIISAKRDIHPCRICGNLSADELCNIKTKRCFDCGAGLEVHIRLICDSRTVADSDSKEADLHARFAYERFERRSVTRNISARTAVKSLKRFFIK